MEGVVFIVVGILIIAGIGVAVFLATRKQSNDINNIVVTTSTNQANATEQATNQETNQTVVQATDQTSDQTSDQTTSQTANVDSAFAQFESLNDTTPTPIIDPPRSPVYTPPQTPVYAPQQSPVYAPPQSPVTSTPMTPAYVNPQSPVYAPPSPPPIDRTQDCGDLITRTGMIPYHTSGSMTQEDKDNLGAWSCQSGPVCKYWVNKYGVTSQGWGGMVLVDHRMKNSYKTMGCTPVPRIVGRIVRLYAFAGTDLDRYPACLNISGIKISSGNTNVALEPGVAVYYSDNQYADIAPGINALDGNDDTVAHGGCRGNVQYMDVHLVNRVGIDEIEVINRRDYTWRLVGGYLEIFDIVDGQWVVLYRSDFFKGTKGETAQEVGMQAGFMRYKVQPPWPEVFAF